MRRLILDEVDEESVGLFESDDKVYMYCAWLGIGTVGGGGMFVGPPLIAAAFHSCVARLIVDCPNPLCVCLNCELAPSLALRAWAGFEIPSRSSLSPISKAQGRRSLPH